MTRRTLALDDRLFAWLQVHAVREPAALARLGVETDALPEGGMRTGREQAQLMALLLELTGARRVLEIGVFTGYGTLAMALALPSDGIITALDVNEHWTAIGRRYWQEAGVADKVELILAPALETLDRLIAEGRAGSYDAAYIDADKKTYLDYYERSLLLLRPGGMLMADNVLWGGAVADPAERTHQTETLRALTDRVHNDARVSMALVPIGDGLLLARKR